MRVAFACLAFMALASPSFAATVIVQGELNGVPLDASIVTTGGTPVTAINAGNRAAGGWIFNPYEATANLCINENGVASGTVSQGDLTCIPPGTKYGVTAGAGPVSVVSSDSLHKFSGRGAKL